MLISRARLVIAATRTRQRAFWTLAAKWVSMGSIRVAPRPEYTGSRDPVGAVRLGSSHAPDGRWTIVVSDDGCGMPDDAPQDAVGLMLSRSLAHQIGGALSRDPGPGTTWRLTLPSLLP
ncbi:MAG: ATP-binding protein [Spirochaetota bacterium]